MGRRRLMLVLGTLLIVFLSAVNSSLWAQSSTTGALTGTVKDSTGAVIPGTTITLINYATSQAQTTTSNTSGIYGFSLLPPGTYGVRLSAPGFKTAQSLPVVINVSEAPALDATLEMGASTVDVACQCRVSQAAATSTGTLVDSKTITSVPLTTRNSTQVMSMASGSAADVNNAGLLGAGSQSVNVNGNTTAGTYTIDGAVSGNTVPNPDTISEFKLQTSQYDAVYGANVPNTNLVTSSGANEIHGDLWEFVRNDIFNANAFFLKATGRPRPNLKQNQFGGTIGGPIKTNKLFYFGSFQGTRQVNGLDPTSLTTIILPPLTNDRAAATLGFQFCPGNKDPSVQSKYLTFAGGTQVACTGANINPIALNLLQLKQPDGSYLIPTPQTILPSGLGFYSISIPSTYHENQYMVNTDYIISSKHTLSGRAYMGQIRQVRSFGTPTSNAGTPFVPGGSQLYRLGDYIGSIRLTSILTPNVANEVRMTYSRTRSPAIGPGIPLAASVGMTPADPLFAELPEINILGSLGTFRFPGNYQSDFTTKKVTYQWSDNVSWTHGKHKTRAGMFFNTQYNERDDTGSSRGKITIQNFTDFLLGLSAAQNGSPLGRSNIQTIQANEGVGPHGELHYQYRTYYASGYVEDDIKVNSRFTLNLGLRWEYITPAVDTLGTISNVWPSLLNLMPIPPASGTLVGNTVASNYNPNLINPYTGLAFGPAPAGVFTRPTESFFQNRTPLDAFAPRFGFAWQPGSSQSRLAVRGGYGWFYQTPTFSANATNVPLFTAPPFAQGYTNTDASNNLSTLQKPFPTTTLGFILRTPTSQLSDRVAGPVYRIPKIQQWNLNTQYNFSGNFSLDLGYVGAYGNDLLLSHGLNQPFLASVSNPINCGYDGVPSDCITTNTSQNAKLRVPIIGETPSALGQNDYTGISWYNSMQATLKKQVSRGLTFQAAYTYSKAQNNTIVYNDQNNLSLDWARATFDRTHRLIANVGYQLPSFIQADGYIGAMTKGWSLSGIIIIQSGTPMTLTDPKGGSVYGSAGTSTVNLCPNATPASLSTSGRDQSRLNSWFNASAICAPAAIGSDGSTGYGNTGQSIVTGPGQFNTDFSIGKTFAMGSIRENSQLAFRVEFYNAFNHPQFSNPGTTFGTASFGVITQTSVAPRLIQFGLKYLF